MTTCADKLQLDAARAAAGLPPAVRTKPCACAAPGRARLAYSSLLVGATTGTRETPYGAKGGNGVKCPPWMHAMCKPCFDTYALRPALELKTICKAVAARDDLHPLLRCRDLADFHRLYALTASCEYCRRYRTGQDGCTSADAAVCAKVPRCELCGAAAGRSDKIHELDARGAVVKCFAKAAERPACRYCKRYRKGMGDCTSSSVLACERVPRCTVCSTKVTLTGEQWKNHVCDASGAIIECRYRCTHCGAVGAHNSTQCTLKLTDKCSYCRRFRDGAPCGALSLKTCPHAPECPVCLRRAPAECMDAQGRLAACKYTCPLCGEQGTHRAHRASVTCSGLFCPNVESAGGRCSYCAKFMDRQCGASKSSHCKKAPICAVCERTGTCIDADGNAAPCTFVCSVCGGQHKAFKGRFNTNVVYCPVVYPDGVQGYQCGHCGERGHNFHSCPLYKEEFISELDAEIGEEEAERQYREHIGMSCATCGAVGHKATTCHRARDSASVSDASVQRVLAACGQVRTDPEGDRERARELVVAEESTKTDFVERQRREQREREARCHNQSRFDEWGSMAVASMHYTADEFKRLSATRAGRAKIRAAYCRHRDAPLADRAAALGRSFERRRLTRCWGAWMAFVRVRRGRAALHRARDTVRAAKRQKTQRDPFADPDECEEAGNLRAAEKRLRELREAKPFRSASAPSYDAADLPRERGVRAHDHGVVPASEFSTRYRRHETTGRAQSIPIPEKPCMDQDKPTELCRLWNSDRRYRRTDPFRRTVQQFRDQDYKRLTERSIFASGHSEDLSGMDPTIPTFFQPRLADGEELRLKRFHLTRLRSDRPDAPCRQRGGVRSVLTLRPAGDLRYRAAKPRRYAEMRRQKQYKKRVQTLLDARARSAEPPPEEEGRMTVMTSFYDGTVVD
jgi:hypothetical protein